MTKSLLFATTLSVRVFFEDPVDGFHVFSVEVSVGTGFWFAII